MASTELGVGFITPVGVRPFLGSLKSTYASSTWSFALPVPSDATVDIVHADTRASTGQGKDLIVTVAANVVTIASGGTDTLAASDVASVIYTIKY